MASIKITDTQAKILATMIEKYFIPFLSENPEYNHWDSLSEMCDLRTRLNTLIEKQKKAENIYPTTVPAPQATTASGGLLGTSGEPQFHERNREQGIAAKPPVMDTDDAAYNQYLDGMLPPPEDVSPYIDENIHSQIYNPESPPGGYEWRK